MSKTVTYTSDKWGGSVTFHDPLTLEQEAAWESAILASKALGSDVGLAEQQVKIIPGILACVERWELKDFPERITLANWPTRPRLERAKLIAWLVKNISDLYEDSVTVPNS